MRIFTFFLLLHKVFLVLLVPLEFTSAQAACVRHACLRAPCIAWPLLLPLFSLSFGPGVLACATRGGGRSEAGHCFHLLSFFFLFSFFYAFCFSPTSGNLPCVKICFPQYFGITRRYMQKKIFCLGNFFIPQKKR